MSRLLLRVSQKRWISKSKPAKWSTMNGKCCLTVWRCGCFSRNSRLFPWNRKFQALRTCHIVFHPACIASRTGFNLNWNNSLRCLAVGGFSWDGVSAKTPHTLLRELPHTFDTKADRLPVDRGEDKQPAGFFGGLDIFDPFPNKKKRWNLDSDSEVNLMRFTRFQEKKQL